ncbi:hypothetical protein [Streptomyces sp. CA-179760]
MTLGLTALTVGQDAVIAICRTWHKTALADSNTSRQYTPHHRTAA